MADGNGSPGRAGTADSGSGIPIIQVNSIFFICSDTLPVLQHTHNVQELRFGYLLVITDYLIE